MKIICLSLLLLLQNSICLLAGSNFYEDYELTRVSSNFKGCTFNESSIIIYGDAGVILRSTNRGSDWEQINLNDSLNIIDMVNNGSNFYGISNKKYIISSSNNGKNWVLKNFGNYTNFYHLFFYNKKIIALLEGKIWVLNENLEKEKEYTFTTDSLYYDGALASSFLVYPSGKGKFGYINLDNDQIGTIDLAAQGLCSDCPVPTHIFSNNANLIYFLLGNNLEQYDLINNTAKFVFMPLKLQYAPFFADSDNVFQIYAVKFSTKNIDSLYFGKADKAINQFSKIKLPGNDRYVVGMKFSDLKFISQDTIIAVGQGKLIYMSFDGGVHWELKSLLNEFSRIFLFDRLNARIIAPKARFLSTTNGGITWMPQKNYDESFVRNNYFSESFRNNCAKYYKDKLNGYFYADNIGQPVATNFVYTDDGGETVKFKTIKNMQHVSNDSRSMFIDFLDSTIIITQRAIYPFPYYLIFDRLNDSMEIEKRTVFTDTLLYNIFKINDTIYAYGRIADDNQKNRFRFYYSTDGCKSLKEAFAFILDSVWIGPIFSSFSQINTDIFSFWSFDKIENNDTISYYKMLFNNINSHNVQELIKTDKAILNIILLNKKYDLFYYEGINDYESILKLKFSNNYKDNFNNWKDYSFNRISPPLIDITENQYLPLKGFLGDSLFAFVAYDTLFNQQYLFYAQLKRPSVVVDELNSQIDSKIYLMKPTPLPAGNYVRIKIYWDLRYDISQANINVYNILGISLLNKIDYTLNKFNNYSGELIINTSSLHFGVYILTAYLMGDTRSTTFIVE